MKLIFQLYSDFVPRVINIILKSQIRIIGIALRNRSDIALRNNWIFPEWKKNYLYLILGFGVKLR